MELLNDISKAITLCCGWDTSELLDCQNKDTLLGKKLFVYVARDFGIEMKDIAKYMGCEISMAVNYYKEAIAEFEGKNVNEIIHNIVYVVTEITLNSHFFGGVSFETDGDKVILIDTKNNVTVSGRNRVQLLHNLRSEVLSKYERITDERFLLKR